jgi:4-alpha-glucanotransferase
MGYNRRVQNKKSALEVVKVGVNRKRKLGILAHISSLPGKYGIGDMGETAFEFVDFLADIGCLAWQVLPIGPTSQISGYSPYSSPSVFAGNITFICPDELDKWGLLKGADLKSMEEKPGESVDFDRAYRVKKKLLSAAYYNFRKDEAYKTRFKELSDEFWNFCARQAYWLEDYSIFCVLKETLGDISWRDWPLEYRSRDWHVLGSFKTEPDVARKLDICRFEQFIFFKQLSNLRDMCRGKGIELIGDMPIYVGYDSSDVWGRQELFNLSEDGRPACVAGVPPDYFSKTGQRWGNPIYRWDRMREDGYSWWMGRFGHNLQYMDRLRIDHFRGFIGYWEIPEEEPTAEKGEWRPGPGRDFFLSLDICFGGGDGLPFIAEDLGVVTDDVRSTMEEFGLPGMKVLQFAFGEDMPQNPYIPHRHRRNCVVYVGTHDNNTVAGWWEEDAADIEKKNFKRYVGAENIKTTDEVWDAMLRMAVSSTANLAVISAQDIIGLGGRARMNAPSTTHGNWTWRLESLRRLREKADAIKDMAMLFDRFDASEEAVLDGEKNARGEEV